MGKVTLGISMSLDGFVAGPNDDVQQVFKWYMSGPREIPVQGGRMTLRVTEESARLLEESFNTTGAMVAGRRMFNIAQAWGGQPPFAPCFIMTHTAPQEWIKTGSPFTFVSNGIESTIALAKEAAGEKNVAIATPSIAQQCLKAGLLDEIHIDLVPFLLGDGVRLFEHLGTSPRELENTETIQAAGVTHLTFRVLK